MKAASLSAATGLGGATTGAEGASTTTGAGGAATTGAGVTASTGAGVTAATGTGVAAATGAGVTAATGAGGAATTGAEGTIASEVLSYASTGFCSGLGFVMIEFRCLIKPKESDFRSWSCLRCRVPFLPSP